ncbi:zonular occludens toxin domain-containing protein [Rheinheimera sp. MM224]|uniref:zonular occludens toxin domain-containing protein n=1 Tax=Rheinheimera sp. MM224 TaxID=3019969 RepID=UPI0021F8303B|nr:zonular occludens toxin domain-containing protein [Rheinheimera sp. MM224]CAI3799080.1 hypothetical protein JAMGFMIE_02238 [Rheinheimera sp. MM224]
MLHVVTGLPGASKSLNTLKFIIENKDFANRPIYYNNVKLVMLDLEVCNSFSGWFYGVYYPSIEKDLATLQKVRKVLLRIHKEGDMATPETFPHLIHLFDAWLCGTGPVDLFVYWVKRLYSPQRAQPLLDYLDITETPQVDHIKRFNLHFTHFPQAAMWYELPRNSVIFVDECQQTFPPRPVGARVPPHCSEFETHRHKGYDVFLVTQDAKLLDNHVRRLAGVHIHFFRPFGGSIIKRIWSDKVIDPDDYFEKKAAQISTAPRDKKYYGLYWSADVHTHKFRIPAKLLLIVPVFSGVAFGIYFVTTGAFVSSAQQADTAEVQQVAAQSAAPPAPSTSQQVQTAPELKVLPFASLLSADTPLSGLCIELTYGGFQVTSNQTAQTSHYFNCVTKAAQEEQMESAEKDEKDKGSKTAESGLVLTLDSDYFEAMGFTFAYYKSTPVLSYNNVAYMFPRFN